MTALTWTASKDGIAHASKPGHSRTLCNLKSQDPRWAWTPTSRCVDCLALEAWPVVRRVSNHEPAERRVSVVLPRSPGQASGRPAAGLGGHHRPGERAR